MAKATELGAPEKAIIFTESRKTQDYLVRVLADSPWKDRTVLFNGSNTDERSKAIYADWKAKHEGTDRVTGSRTADMRSALVDYFREQGHIMIATEAGAEGINLQFCSLVVNYDLPWNPQRIEQRIGRCHRYGQKHDVVVLNFLNSKNAADQRVFQLLSEKFRLFEGVFGASDDVLGAIESLDQTEDHIVLVATTGKGPVDEEAARRLFSLPGTVGSQRLSFGSPDTDQQIKEARKGAVAAVSLESERNSRRRTLFEAQDEIDHKRGELIAQIESKLTQKVKAECLFTICWTVV